MATSIYVSGGIVYTTAYYLNYQGCYWTGPIRTDLPGSSIGNEGAFSICVSGGIVYTAGYYCDGTKFIPCYWTGTVWTNLPIGSCQWGIVSSIFVE